MRPKSIVIFDWLFLGSLVLGIVNSLMSFSTITERMKLDPAMARAGSFVGPMTTISLVVGLGISLLLWFFISRRASNVARWILVAFTAFGILGVVQNFQNPMYDSISRLPMLVLTLAQVVAAVMPFRSDAKDWFDRKSPPVDPNVFN